MSHLEEAVKGSDSELKKLYSSRCGSGPSVQPPHALSRAHECPSSLAMRASVRAQFFVLPSPELITLPIQCPALTLTCRLQGGAGQAAGRPSRRAERADLAAAPRMTSAVPQSAARPDKWRRQTCPSSCQLTCRQYNLSSQSSLAFLLLPFPPAARCLRSTVGSLPPLTQPTFIPAAL